MADEAPSAAGLVTTTEPPFTTANPDPAHALDPIKAGQPVSSPHREQPKKAKRRRTPKAKREAAVKSAAKANDAKADAASAAAAAKEEQARAFLDEGKAAYAASLAHEVDSFAELPSDAALMLRLSNGEAFIDGTISVGEGEIVPAPIGHTYTKAIEVGPDGPPMLVAEVWLVSLAGEAVRCAVGPFSAGAGYHAKIPAGHLKF